MRDDDIKMWFIGVSRGNKYYIIGIKISEITMLEP